jgi:CheY-like chemotaxis protein
MHAITDKGTISISTRNISSDATATLNLPAKDYVCITVKDSGAGMSEEVMTRIFEPYYSTKGKGGTGLGLTQVYGFTQGAQGEVRVSSKLNEGSSFMLYLPRTMNDRGDAELLDEAPQSTQALSILLVDDEEMIRKYLSRVLKNSGHHVVQACDATEAIRCLERDQVDLMVSDVMMPGRDGFELAQEVLERFPSVKIQMISGYYDQKTLPKGLPAWLKDQLISKPFKPEVLIERVNQLFCAEK